MNKIFGLSLTYKGNNRLFVLENSSHNKVIILVYKIKKNLYF